MATKSNSTVTTLDDATPDTQAQATAIADDAVAVKGQNHDSELSGGTVTLTVHSSNDEGGNQAVKIGLNGYMYLLPRNKPCQVPAEVAEVIRNAVVDHMRLSADGKSHVTESVPRYAFQITS